MYDPLGMLAPFILQGKILMQQACQENIDWNDTVSDDQSAKWKKWKEQPSDLHSIKVPRCLRPPNFVKTNRTGLHYFSDASPDSYELCCYKRLVNGKGDVQFSLVIEKTRVAPLKSMTIPLLEL